MTGSLRLSALLLLLLSRWAYADLEKGEDEYVRSWVIIEEQLVPPSRDEVLAAGSDIAGGGSAGGVGRRITPKSVFVAPSFNKCSEGYRPDSMGRCVKVVKLNQAAQWDFLIKQLNSMYGAGAAVGGGGFPMPAASAFQPPPMTTTTVEPSLQKTDSPGPFQLNIPLAGGIDFSNQMTDSVDEQFTTSTSAGAGTTITDDDGAVSTNPVSTIITTIPDDDDVDVYTNDHTTVASITTNAVSSSTTKPRPYRNRYQTQTEDNANTVTPTYDLQTYSTNIATDMKTKYVDSIRASTVGMDDSLQTTSSTITAIPSSSSTPNVVTTTAVGVMDIEGQMTTTTVSTPTTTEIKEEDVMTVLAVAAAADVSDDIGPSFTTRLPSTTTRISFTTSSGGRTQHLATDTVTPEYYNDQSEDPTSVSKLDCSAPNAYLYYPACASLRQQQQLQQQQLQQLQQKQVLLQQHQQQQQIYQQQQQFYQQQQLQQHNHVTTALMKRPIPSGGVQVRFPEEEDHTSSVVAEDANLIRFPGLTPYRTTNKMYESSRHPTWWPTGWPEQQQQSGDTVNRQHQQYRIQHHIPQQQQDARLWEFGSRLPKSTTTTTAVPPSPPPTQWFHRFF